MDWKAIRAEYESSNITLKALAEKYGISEGTMRSRKNREKWQRNNATQRKNVATGKRNKPPPEPKIENNELTDKQRFFCLYYLKYWNATKAYQKAYGCDYLSAKTNGNRLMTNANINLEIDRLKSEQFGNLKLDGQAVLQKYIDIAFTDITDYLTFGKKEVPVIGMMGPIKDKDGNQLMKEVNYVDFHESAAVDGALISEVKQGRDGVSIKLADKMKALEKLELYFDLLPDKFKRRIEEERLKLDQAKAGDSGEEEVEDDGFLEALNGRVNEVWSDEDTGED